MNGSEATILTLEGHMTNRVCHDYIHTTRSNYIECTFFNGPEVIKNKYLLRKHEILDAALVLMSELLNHSFNQFVQMADLFGHWLIHQMDLFKRELFTNEALLCLFSLTMRTNRQYCV